MIHVHGVGLRKSALVARSDVLGIIGAEFDRGNIASTHVVVNAHDLHGSKVVVNNQIFVI